MKIFINVIGILIFFINRYAGRKDKTKDPNIKYWLKDNWEQLTVIALFDIALMILMSKEGLNIDFSKLEFLPNWLQFTGDLAFSFVLGVAGAWLAYCAYKKLIIDKRK